MVIGYKTLDYIILKTDKNIKLVFNLDRSIVSLDEINISAERTRFEELIGYDESFWNVTPKIKLLLSDMDIDFINPVNKMKEYQKNSTDALYIGHTTPLGNKVMANVIFQYLINKTNSKSKIRFFNKILAFHFRTRFKRKRVVSG